MGNLDFPLSALSSPFLGMHMGNIDFPLSALSRSEYIVARPTSTFLLIGGLLLIFAVYLARFVGTYCAKRWEGNARKVQSTAMAIMACVTIWALLVYGLSIVTVQAVVLCAILLFSSYSDIKTRELDDYAHCLILTTALIGHGFADLFGMIISALIVGGVMLLVGVISKGGGIGGADIKLSAACALLLGLQKATIGVCIGLIIAVVCNMIKNKKKGKKEGFPLVPYLAIGFMAVFFIK